MNITDVLDYIDHTDQEEIEMIRYELKNRNRPPRVEKTDIIKDDIARLAAVVPRTSTVYKGHRYNMTCAYFVRVLRDLTDMITHNYAVKYSTRGYPCWCSHDSLNTDRIAEYQYAFHALTDTVLDLMKRRDTDYSKLDESK